MQRVPHFSRFLREVGLFGGRPGPYQMKIRFGVPRSLRFFRKGRAHGLIAPTAAFHEFHGRGPLRVRSWQVRAKWTIQNRHKRRSGKILSIGRIYTIGLNSLHRMEI